MTEQKTYKMHVTLTHEERGMLEEMAKRHHRSMASLIRLAIRFMHDEETAHDNDCVWKPRPELEEA